MLGKTIERLFKRGSHHEHKHNFVVFQEIRHAPIKGGGHTNYFLMKCSLCPEAFIFGEEDFKLTTPEHQEKVYRFVESRGLKLELAN